MTAGLNSRQTDSQLYHVRSDKFKVRMAKMDARAISDISSGARARQTMTRGGSRACQPSAGDPQGALAQNEEPTAAH